MTSSDCDKLISHGVVYDSARLAPPPQEEAAPVSSSALPADQSYAAQGTH